MNPILIFLGIIALWFIWANIFGKDPSEEERNPLEAPPSKKPNYNPNDFGFNPAR